MTSGIPPSTPNVSNVWRPLSLGVCLLTLSALYLVVPAYASMHWTAAAVVLLHIALGLLLSVPFALHLLRAFREKRRSAFPLAVCAALCFLSGCWLFLLAAVGRSTAKEALVWWLHLVGGFGGAAVFGLSFMRFRARPKPVPQAAAPSASILALFVLMLTLPGAFWAGADALLYNASDYYRDLTATAPKQAQNPLFPAGTRLAEGQNAVTTQARWQEQSAEYCGRNGCHEAEYREWERSAHRHADADPFYRAVRDAYEAQSGDAAQWCSGCHAPRRALTQFAYKKEGGAEGLTHSVDCIACHAAVGTPTRTGNGRMTLDVPQTYPFAAERDGWRKALHSFLLNVRPRPHVRAFQKSELLASPDFCSHCHRQSFNVPQNGYLFMRGSDTYGDWAQSGFSGRVARSAQFANRPPQTCQSCHFPREPSGRIAHRSPGANSALLWLNGDQDGLHQQEALRKRHPVTLDLFAIRRANPEAGRPETWLAPLDAPIAAEIVRPGDTVTLDLLVSNPNIGHRFPAGYEDLKEVWLEVTLTDARGRVLLSNGVLPSAEAPIPPDVHAYRALPLDRAGKEITLHNLTDQVATVYRRSVPAGGSEVARYKFTLPSRSPGGEALALPLRLQARLRGRHLRPAFVTWALGDDRPATPQPIATFAEAQRTLPVNAPGSPTLLLPAPKPKDALRLADYGLALLAPAEGADLNRAIRAFRHAQKLDPNRPEPYLGLGRAYLREPALLAARAQFEIALRLAPDHPEALASLGLIYARQGQFDRAVSLLKPLTQRFPQDGTLWRDLGTALYQQGAYREAGEAFERALASDPDDAKAHFQLQQAFKSQQRLTEARREETIGRYLGANRLQARLVSDFLRTRPEQRNAAQPFPEYALVPPKK